MDIVSERYVDENFCNHHFFLRNGENIFIINQRSVWFRRDKINDTKMLCKITAYANSVIKRTVIFCIDSVQFQIKFILQRSS